MKDFLLVFIFFLASQNSFSATQALTATALDGSFFDLSAQKNKITIINFWAQWCYNCRQEIVILDEIYHEYKSLGLEIIGVSIDQKKDREKVLRVLAAVSSYPNLMISDVQKISLEEPNEIPFSYVIDGNGEVIKKLRGVVIKKDLEKLLQPLLTQNVSQKSKK